MPSNYSNQAATLKQNKIQNSHITTIYHEKPWNIFLTIPFNTLKLSSHQMIVINNSISLSFIMPSEQTQANWPMIISSSII